MVDAPIDAAHTVGTRYWTRLPDGRTQCDLCPRLCRLRDGQRGMCFVRANVGGEVVLTTYGRSSGFCVDPIEKKPLNHFLPGTGIRWLGPAITTRVKGGSALTRQRYAAAATAPE